MATEDDAVLGFQDREDTEKFPRELQEPAREFGLELHPAKTRLIEFGRYAAEWRGRRGAGKPGTSNSWVSPTICGNSHVVRRRPEVRTVSPGKLVDALS
jgi:RNA-directed DNA polymerase